MYRLRLVLLEFAFVVVDALVLTFLLFIIVVVSITVLIMAASQVILMAHTARRASEAQGSSLSALLLQVLQLPPLKLSFLLLPDEAHQLVCLVVIVVVNAALTVPVAVGINLILHYFKFNFSYF